MNLREIVSLRLYSYNAFIMKGNHSDDIKINCTCKNHSSLVICVVAANLCSAGSRIDFNLCTIREVFVKRFYSLYVSLLLFLNNRILCSVKPCEQISDSFAVDFVCAIYKVHIIFSLSQVDCLSPFTSLFYHFIVVITIKIFTNFMHKM